MEFFEGDPSGNNKFQWRSALMILVVACSLSFLGAPRARAADGVAAVISTDGALVYSAPDEESAVLGQLPMGQAVRVSSGTTGSPQRFHKIRIGTKIGYIDALDVSVSAGAAGASTSSATTKPTAAAPTSGSPAAKNAATSQTSTGDSQSESQTSAPVKARAKKAAKSDEGDEAESDEGQSTQEAAKPAAKKKKKKKKVAKKKNPNEPKMSIFETRYIGIEGGAQDYQEGIVGVPASTTLAVYGIKFTGPDLILKGPVLDVNLLLHYGAPPYYNSLSAIQPNGFILFFDTMLVLPLINKEDFMFYIAGGPLLVYSKFGLVNANRLMDLQALNLGIDGSAGIGFRTGKVAIKLEAKYYVEKQSYKAFLGAIQTSY